MKKINELEMKTEVPSYSGELKMVKVRRGKRGHKKSRSLVFRILRTSKTVSDDSGIKVSSSEDESKELPESPTLPLQLKMPRLLFKEENLNESGISECGSPGDLSQQNKYENRQILSKSSSLRNVSKRSWTEDLTFQGEDEDQKLLNIGSGMCSSVGTRNARKYSPPEISTLQNKGEDQNFVNNASSVSSSTNIRNLSNSSPENSEFQNRYDENVLSYGLDVLDSAGVHDTSTCSLPGDSVSQNEDQEVLNNFLSILSGNTNTENVEKARPLPKLEEAKSYDLRSSSRHTLLPIQKSIHSDSVNLFSRFHSKTEAQPYSIEPCAHGVAEKKRRRKRNEPRTAEYPKRKYGRPGRPPKSATRRDFCVENSGIDNTSVNAPVTDPITKNVAEYAVGENDKGVLRLPKNSVWTLVPRELFKSDFFKSQVIKVRHPNPAKRGKPSMPSSYPPLTIPNLPCRFRPALPTTDKRLQLKFPKFILNRPPAAMRLPTPDKRPTVIYFKSEKSSCDESLPARTPVKAEANSSSINTESMNIRNDILYLCNKYPVLDSAIIKKCYDLTKGDVNETNCILSDLLSKNSSFILAERSTEVNNFESGPVFDLGSNYSCDTTVSDPSGYLPSVDNVDTLCRSIIIESMRILFSEESVLQ